MRNWSTFELFISPRIHKLKYSASLPRVMAGHELLGVVNGEIAGVDEPLLGESRQEMMCSMVLRGMQTLERRMITSINVRLLPCSNAAQNVWRLGGSRIAEHDNIPNRQSHSLPGSHAAGGPECRGYERQCEA
jgi:hypothetical protein